MLVASVFLCAPLTPATSSFGVFPFESLLQFSSSGFHRCTHDHQNTSEPLCVCLRSFCLSVRPSVCLSVRLLSVCLSVGLSVRRSVRRSVGGPSAVRRRFSAVRRRSVGGPSAVRWSVRLIGPSVCRSVGPSVRGFVGPSVRPSVLLFVCLSTSLPSVCPSVRPSVRLDMCYQKFRR